MNETEEEAMCECDHLTNFAILLVCYKMPYHKQGNTTFPSLLPHQDVTPKRGATDNTPPALRKTLEVFSYIGAVVSIFCLILTILTYIRSR